MAGWRGARRSLLPLALVSALLRWPWSFSVLGPAHRPRLSKSSRIARPAETLVPQGIEQESTEESLVPELMQLAQGDGAELNNFVEEQFDKISPEDVSELQFKVMDGGDDGALAQQVGEAIQTSLQSRLSTAKDVLSDLITNSKGDVNLRLRKTLKTQASPLPLLMCLQLNIAEAQSQGDTEKLQVLMHMSTVINEELEKKVSRTKALLNKLLRIEDENIRDNILRHHLTPQEVGSGAPDLDGEDGDGAKLMAALVTPARLAPAIDEVVKAVDRNLVAALGRESEDRFETLDRIRGVAIHARAVIGDVYGQEEMNQFSADLTPAFNTLMIHKQARAAQAASEASADGEKKEDSKDAPTSEKQD